MVLPGNDAEIEIAHDTGLERGRGVEIRKQFAGNFDAFEIEAMRGFIGGVAGIRRGTEERGIRNGLARERWSRVFDFQTVFFDAIKPLQAQWSAAGFQKHRAGFYGDAMNAVVVHDRADGFELETGACGDDDAKTSHTHALASGERLAAQIHFQLFHAGAVFENKFSFPGVRPEDFAVEANGMSFCWDL